MGPNEKMWTPVDSPTSSAGIRQSYISWQSPSEPSPIPEECRTPDSESGCDCTTCNNGYDSTTAEDQVTFDALMGDLRVGGYTLAEIATRMGYSKRNAARDLMRIRENASARVKLVDAIEILRALPVPRPLDACEPEAVWNTYLATANIRGTVSSEPDSEPSALGPPPGFDELEQLELFDALLSALKSAGYWAKSISRNLGCRSHNGKRYMDCVRNGTIKICTRWNAIVHMANCLRQLPLYAYPCTVPGLRQLQLAGTMAWLTCDYLTFIEDDIAHHLKIVLSYLTCKSDPLPISPDRYLPARTIPFEPGEALKDSWQRLANFVIVDPRRRTPDSWDRLRVVYKHHNFLTTEEDIMSYPLDLRSAIRILVNYAPYRDRIVAVRGRDKIHILTRLYDALNDLYHGKSGSMEVTLNQQSRAKQCDSVVRDLVTHLCGSEKLLPETVMILGDSADISTLKAQRAAFLRIVASFDYTLRGLLSVYPPPPGTRVILKDSSGSEGRSIPFVTPEEISTADYSADSPIDCMDIYRALEKAMGIKEVFPLGSGTAGLRHGFGVGGPVAIGRAATSFASFLIHYVELSKGRVKPTEADARRATAILDEFCDIVHWARQCFGADPIPREVRGLWTPPTKL
jgi:hypothetical protein